MRPAISLILVVVLVRVSDALSRAPPRIDPEANYDVVRLQAAYMHATAETDTPSANAVVPHVVRTCYFVNTKAAFLLLALIMALLVYAPRTFKEFHLSSSS